ncbi:hypothetical protein ACIP93_15310 [Streptomyces sp. NPDC088745]|uniref:hypothetical protein n=1 Tax=Streptomyces sp. NPDC088745 TaxID=3365884 RepID=UPI00381B5050
MLLPPDASERLHDLAFRFDALHSRLVDLPPSNAPEYLGDLRRHLTVAHTLTDDTLSLLHDLHHTAPDVLAVKERGAFGALSIVATRAASLSACLVDVATAPLTHDERIEDALDHLEGCAEGCRAAARLLTGQPRSAQTPLRLASSAPATDAGPHLTPYQHSALRLIAQGQATLHQAPFGRPYLSAPGGRQILLTTYEALLRQRLIARDTRFPLPVGQPVTATSLGRSVLAALPPPPATPVPGQPLRPVPAAHRHRTGAR